MTSTPSRRTSRPSRTTSRSRGSSWSATVSAARPRSPTRPTIPTGSPGLVLVATPGRLPDEQVNQIEGALEADYDGTMASIWKRLLANATPTTRQTVEAEKDTLPKEVAAAIIRSTFEFDPVPPLKAYAGPTLTISTPPEGPVTELHELVPGIDHQTVEGTSHWIQLDQPEAFDRILDGFLETVDRTPVGARQA